MIRYLLAAAVAVPIFAWAVDPEDTRLLRMPTISDEHVAFVYDGDVWLAGRAGGAARRLTTAEGQELNPVLSPDGRWLAFSGNYDGNVDAYVMPATGGEVRRLTWHPGEDVVVGFSGDSDRVLFYTPRTVHTNRHRHLYTVAVAGGPPERLPVPTGIDAALAPDGSRIAFNPHPPPFLQWKHYRGGRISRLWIMDLATYETIEVPKPPGGANDTDPMWISDTLYFTSDRDGEFNLYRYVDGAVEKLTAFADFPVLSARAGGGVIVFEQAGRLHTLDPATGAIESLTIAARSDLREARPRWASGDTWVRDVHASPDGERLALEYRGEIVTVPAEKGFPRNLSLSPGAHDRSPAWSPDGTRVAWFSDADGAYGLHVLDLAAREPKRYELDGAGFYFEPVWSPDGTRIAYRDNALALYVIDLATGATTMIAQEPVYSPVITLRYRWSPDSRWLAYTRNEAGLTEAVYLHDVADGVSFPVTDGLTDVGAPAFDPNGAHLYVLASTNAGPVKDWFAQSNNDMTMTHGVYVITLAADGPDPLAPQNDEVARPADDSKAPSAKADDRDDTDDGNGDEAPPATTVDRAGLARRIQALPVGEATRHGLAVGRTGTVFWIETVGRTSFDAHGGAGKLQRFTLEKREAETLIDEVDAFELTADGEKLLYRRQGQWFLAEAGAAVEAGKGAIALDDVKVRVVPRAEWAQIFDEAWRINRDYFYADNYHGADWQAIRAKYAPFVAHAATREDVMQIIRWMASELAVGHSYSGPGETIADPAEVSVGLLGADYAIDQGHYRFARIFRGQRWSPELAAPLAGPGVDVEVGDYLLAVDGVAVTADASVFRFFEQAVGRPVKLTVADAPDGEARELSVVPIADETALRYRHWVDGNRAYVDEATAGRIAYVHVPDTNVQGHAAFKRDFYPQSHKAGIIVDERYNGGGLFADYYIDILRRPFAAYWAMRYGDDLASPRAAIHGPKVMIADEMAGSGGDLLPWLFKKYDLGPVVGTRTWGGLVGILGFPTLMDGGTITAPNLAIWDEDGWIVENVGVPPDYEVFQWPEQVNAGRDPQLEKAVALALEALADDPPTKPARPPFPERAQKD